MAPITTADELTFKPVDAINIENIKTMDALGNLVPVSTVAKLELTEGSHEIKRFDFKRSKTLTGDIEEEKITSIIANKKLQEIFNK